MPLKKTLHTCPQCGAEFWGDPRNLYCSRSCATKARNSKKPKDSRGAGGMRSCHDCGGPTTDYRCDACWEKLRREHGIAESVS